MHTRCGTKVTLLQPRNKGHFFLFPEIHPDTADCRPASGTIAFLGGQRVRVFRYLVVELLDCLAALRRLRLHRCRFTWAARFNRLVLRLHVDYANTERGAAQVVAGCVSRLVDRHHVAVNDLQSDRLRGSD